MTILDSTGTALVALRACQDGEPLAVTLGRDVGQQDLVNGNESLCYYLHEATFPPGRTTIIVSHFAKPTAQ